MYINIIFLQVKSVKLKPGKSTHNGCGIDGELFRVSVCSSAITAFCTSRNFSNIIVATLLRSNQSCLKFKYRLRVILAVGSSSALFLKSEEQKVEYFFMINEEVNGSYDLKYRFIKQVEDQVYEDRATVQELKRCFDGVHLGLFTRDQVSRNLMVMSFCWCTTSADYVLYRVIILER
ncbi:hypothetical protein HanIR_Chr04g0158681 [Helianthus annuus]|nr:hypothetical protein HanIR_Chr04g0158681 [Helianthus annuus]